MSLGSTWVLGDDGLYYQNPVMGEFENWYICFDDDDPPELVIAKTYDVRPAAILKNAKLGYTLMYRVHQYATRAVGRGETFKECQAWFLRRRPNLGPALRKELLRDPCEGR